MADDSRRVTSPDPDSSTEELSSEATTPDSIRPIKDTSPLKPPTLRTSYDASAGLLSSSSSPLGAVNAARRPAQPSSRASGLTSDIQAKMKAFSLSRQGAPANRPGLPGQVSTGSIPSVGLSGGLSGAPALSTGLGQSAPPAGPIGGLRLPPGITRPNAPNWNSSSSPSANSPRMMSPRPGMGGLAAKRGLKPGGMKLSDATKPADPSEKSQQADPESGSQFKKYSSIIDTQKGTLSFKNKAVIHGGGIDFSTGNSFSISLDEVDTIDELGKGNYGTVFMVRHARPKIRRPGMGLRGNMQRQSSISSNSSSPDDSTPSLATSGVSGLVMAMKEIRLELDDAKFAAIIMELDILHRCISPFIIDFYGAFFQEGSVYICMEHMDGGSIDKLYGGGVPEGVLRKITLSTIMGLKCLKDEHNIIHRDVKPTNILCNTRGQVKICDFGVSGNLVASIAKTNIGCQSYMAPERISGGGMGQAGAGGGSYSVQSDIWSLALSIIECALGRYPYPPETYDNIFSQLSAIVDGDPPGLPADKFSVAARDFVDGCLNKIPKARPTYAMLLRHAWLAPLMKPPTIQEDEEAESSAESGDESGGDLLPVTADKEVAAWVNAALERKRSGKMVIAEKPALHAVALDAVPGSPLLDRDGVDTDGLMPKQEIVIAPNPGEKIIQPELVFAKVDSMDFAGGLGSDGSNGTSPSQDGG